MRIEPEMWGSMAETTGRAARAIREVTAVRMARVERTAWRVGLFGLVEKAARAVESAGHTP